MFNWDDLRVFLAAARAGSLGLAAQRLSIDTATVGRRVARLESALKATLLVRSPEGLQLTAVGSQLLQTALEAEAAMEAASHVTRPDVVAGVVRISTAEGFGTALLAPALPHLLRQRPGLRIELAAQSGFLSPSRREVDAAVTLSAPGESRLIVEPLSAYQLALYASRAYLAASAPIRSVEDLRKHPTVGYVDDLLFAPELRYLDEVLPGLIPTIASTSIQAQASIIAADGGVGVLPTFLAGDLVRVLPGEVLIERRFWLSTYREVHGAARMRAVRRWLKELVAAEKDRLNPY